MSPGFLSWLTVRRDDVLAGTRVRTAVLSHLCAHASNDHSGQDAIDGFISSLNRCPSFMWRMRVA
jgi:hypothetical protein